MEYSDLLKIAFNKAIPAIPYLISTDPIEVPIPNNIRYVSYRFMPLIDKKFLKYWAKKTNTFEGITVNVVKNETSDQDGTQAEGCQTKIKIESKFLDLKDGDSLFSFTGFPYLVKYAKNIEYFNEEKISINLLDIFYKDNHALETISKFGDNWERLLCFIARPEDVKDPSLKLLVLSNA